jgi:hypothetical protein
VLAAICVLAIALASPGSALASNRQEMILQDDAQLIYSDQAHVSEVLKGLTAIGVDRVRVSVVWQLVAPHASSSKRPKFNATNPAAYPNGVWARWDYLDRIAHQVGIQVYFQPTAPAPNWATTPLPIPQGYRWSHDPNAQDYGQFVQAVATRYSGHYKVNGSALPRVSYWGLWNEPNIGGWMTPQWTKLKNGQFVQASPAIYRGMVDAAWSALVKTGHRDDTILIGETAAYGATHDGFAASMDPLVFMRALYCEGSNYQPLRGNAATEIDCPASGNRAAFVRANPALFEATGWAHHPYDFTNPPNFHRTDPNSATLSNLNRIETALDRSHRAYSQRTGTPIYITEWGVQSRKPDPFLPFSQAQQAEFLNEGEYMAWKDPQVASFAQFLLVDNAPNTQDTKGSQAYWSTFQTGLLTYPYDQPKPAYYAFVLPIWLPNPQHGPHVYVWAQIRPKSSQVGYLQFEAQATSDWTIVAEVSSTNPEGFITTHVSLPSAGSLRLAWGGPDGVMFSRTVQVN